MRRSAVRRLVLGLLACCTFPQMARALPPRMWVSISGTDSATCGPATTPCRTFQYAHDHIAPGGEIDVRESGGFGPLTITKAISVVNDGSEATIQAASGNGITINAGPSDAVHIRGLAIDGAGTGANGILFNSGGSISIANCVIRHFHYTGSGYQSGNGVLINPVSGSVSASISDTLVADNGLVGAFIAHAAVGTAAITAAIDRVSATNNSIGIDVSSELTSQSISSMKVSISRSNIANNTTTGIRAASTFSSLIKMVMIDSSVTGNGTGLFLSGPIIALADRMALFLSNSLDVSVTQAASLYTFQSNTWDNSAVNTGGQIIAATPH